ncbi:MAG: DGQHR domain-containing protein [Bacteroidales bacterium]|jgi:DNA sulfur modification protein DndB|nr:DGQHR domain-containing protein [Bacteroidales bacterium]MCK4638160.1 DGQHR domain-containing protein [Bacteroidales bacterium]
MKKSELSNDSISLPALKGKIGDWYYYITLLTFNEIKKRVFLPEEIDKKYKDKESMKLEDWIQRDLDPKRINDIVSYLKRQPQRFFNSIILGIYDGKPSWQELKISFNNIYENEVPANFEYIERTFGILTLSGEESIFAIDGQHRAIGIRESIKKYPNLLGQEEITAIFVAHKNDEQGKIRTRRLFSTLNRYAKPVNKSEIIALSEDNNCSILTRYFVENSNLFSDKIVVNKNRSISIDNKTAFTNILSFNDIIETLTTNRSVASQKVSGEPFNEFIKNRESKENLERHKNYLRTLFSEVIDRIPSLKSFFIENGEINRRNKSTSLLFRPIGQNVFFSVLKVSIENRKKQSCLDFFSKDDFNLNNPIWRQVFWDEETENILTEKSRQRYAILLILEALNINIRRTKKDIEIYKNLGIEGADLIS